MAETDFELKIESVKGEMKRNTGDGIQILRFEFGAEAARDGASGAAKQRRTYTDVKFSKLTDRASPTILSMLATNSKIRTATLTAKKAAGDKRLVFYKVILSDGYISSYKIVGADFEDKFGSLPRDEFTINFRKIQVEYVPQGQGGDRDGGVVFMDEINVA